MDCNSEASGSWRAVQAQDSMGLTSVFARAPTMRPVRVKATCDGIVLSPSRVLIMIGRPSLSRYATQLQRQTAFTWHASCCCRTDALAESQGAQRHACTLQHCRCGGDVSNHRTAITCALSPDLCPQQVPGFLLVPGPWTHAQLGAGSLRPDANYITAKRPHRAIAMMYGSEITVPHGLPPS